MRMPERLPRYALRCVVTVLLTTDCAPGRPSQSPIPEGSPSGRNEPLIVIDGTPVFEQRVGQTLAALTPQDVLRIDVLKDAASTALYGMRGGNGVIVITTRHQ